jgi:hypothetical protein
MKQRLFVFTLAIFMFAMTGLFTCAWAQGQPLTFSVMSDMPDWDYELTTFQQYMVDHNRHSSSAFLIHTGDIFRAGCSESKYADVANTLKMLAVPAYIIPGDNETTDCANPAQGLSYWKKYFINFEQNFCGASNTERYSARPENVAFMMNGVLFVGINIPGGSPVDINEWNARLQADADWVRQQLQAKAAQVRAAVVFGHAGPDSLRDLFFTPFRQAAATFGKPVLYMHGNIHKYLVNKPWPEKNILRLVVPKGITEPPVEVTVTMDKQNTFTMKRYPWVGAQPNNMPPCANAGPDQTIFISSLATLQGKASDDGDPNPPGALTTTWSKVSGPGTVTFDNASTPITAARFSVAGTYVLRLTANDGQLQSSDEMTITVQTPETKLFINDLSVTEGNAGVVEALFTVTLTNLNGKIVTVEYQTADGTATAGNDYVASSGTLTFPKGTRKLPIAIKIKGDQIVERNETFFVNLSNSTNAIIQDGQGKGTILNDEIAIPPNAPDSLVAKTTGASAVDLKWLDQSHDEEGFKLERKTAGGVFTQIAVIGPNANYYNDTGLNPSTIYSYRVRAFKIVGNSAYSNTNATETASGIVADPSLNIARNKSISASSSDNSYPAINAVDGNAGDSYWRSGNISSSPVAWVRVDLGSVQVVGRAVIVWKDNYYAKGYELQISNNGADWTAVYSTTTGAGGNEDFSFAPIYARYIRLYMTANLKSNYRIYEFELYSGPVTAPPQAPSNLAANATSNSTISLTWKYPLNDANGFKIERAVSGGNFSQVATVGAKMNFFNDGGLSGNTTYVYRVRAYNFIGESGYSSLVSAKTFAGSGGANPNMNWALRKLLTASSSDTTQPPALAADSSINTYWQSGSVAGGIASVWLRVDLGTPRPVGRIVVKWKDVYYAKAYEIQVSSDQLNWQTAHQIISGGSGAQDFAFPQTRAQYVQIHMTKNNESRYRIAEFEVYSGRTASITKRGGETLAEAALPDEFMLQQNYPNPFPARGLFDNPSTRIRFGLPKASHVAIKVYTINGAEVKTLIDGHYAAGMHEVTFNAKNLPSGTYFYVMQVGEVRLVRRLMLVK